MLTLQHIHDWRFTESVVQGIARLQTLFTGARDQNFVGFGLAARCRRHLSYSQLCAEHGMTVDRIGKDL